MRLLVHLAMPLLLFPSTAAFVIPTASSPFATSKSLAERGHPPSSTAMHMSIEPVLQALSQALIAFPSSPITLTQKVQMAGETSFAALFVLAAIQGALAMNQYNSNPVGGLIVPPGLTIGDEDAKAAGHRSAEEEEGGGSLTTTTTTSAMRNRPTTEIISDSELEKMLCDASDTKVSCSMKKWWHHVTQALVLILPWIASGPVGLGLMRCSHLMHMAVIMGLAHLYDFFRKLPTVPPPANEWQDTEDINDNHVFSRDHPRVLVIGDSMAVGIGSCEVFDEAKAFDLPLHKHERLEYMPEDGSKRVVDEPPPPGPVFPMVLARTLSHRLNKPVSWRSAGVDGGDTTEIGQYLLDVVVDEVARGHAPDVVVVLTGSNDLKQILKGTATVRGFRSSLMTLAQEIRTISPRSTVVFPSLPTFRLDGKSILNIFPLTIFLDGIIGFWDAQKSVVADECPGVVHVGLTAAEVNSWYKDEKRGRDKGRGGISLISADGIHPNGKCYAKWAASVGNKLVDLLKSAQEEEKKIAKEKNLRPVYGDVVPSPVFVKGT